MKKLIKGGNVMRISLPIIIFSNISALQHIAHNKGFGVSMMKKAACMKNAVE